jgi:uncharacterized protein (DUF1778 family)
MPRTELKGISVYVTEAHKKVLEDAAALENRSVSNFLLDLGMRRATEMGLSIGISQARAKRGRKPATHVG